MGPFPRVKAANLVWKVILTPECPDLTNGFVDKDFEMNAANVKVVNILKNMRFFPHPAKYFTCLRFYKLFVCVE